MSPAQSSDEGVNVRNIVAGRLDEQQDDGWIEGKKE